MTAHKRASIGGSLMKNFLLQFFFRCRNSTAGGQFLTQSDSGCGIAQRYPVRSEFHSLLDQHPGVRPGNRAAQTH